MEKRRNERFEFIGQVFWDYFAQSEGKRTGVLINVSQGGCLLATAEEIEPRRWLRVIAHEPSSQVGAVIIGRVVHASDATTPLPDSEDCFSRSHRLYGIEFTFPNYFSLAGTREIAALSRRNLMVRSCLILNSRSPLRPGFLA